MSERRRTVGVTRRVVARGALGGALLLLGGAADRVEGRHDVLRRARAFLRKRVEYMADLTLARDWLQRYRAVAKSSAAVTAAHSQVRTVVSVIDVLTSAVSDALDEVEGVSARKSVDLTDSEAYGLIACEERADEALRIVRDFRRELQRTGSSLRRFDRMARGIEVET